MTLARKLLRGVSQVAIAGVATSNSGGTTVTSHPVALPSNIQAGDLLLALFICLGSGTTVTLPGGWTRIVDVGNGDGNRPFIVAYRVATGSEGASITITTSPARTGAYIAMRIVNYQGVPEAASFSTGTSTAPNPSSLSPSWGADSPTLWIPCIGAAAATLPSISSYPSGYQGGVSSSETVNTTKIVAGAASIIKQTASEDPGAFAIAVSSVWFASTIGVRGQ